MNLEDLKPTRTKLSLESVKKDLYLDPVTLLDEVWLNENYSQEELADIFTQVNMTEISRIAFRLLDDKSKMLFETKDVIFVTEDGEKVEKTMGGVDLFRSMCIGWNDKLALINAINIAIGASRPEDDGKKKVILATRNPRQIGLIFLMFFLVSMVGLLIIFFL